MYIFLEQHDCVHMEKEAKGLERNWNSVVSVLTKWV